MAGREVKVREGEGVACFLGERARIMKRTLHLAALIVALAVVLPAGADDKKVDPAKLPADQKDAASKMITAGELTGKLLNVEAAKKTVNLEVTLTYAVPNLSAIQAIANLKLQLATTRDPNAARSYMVQMAQQEANAYQIKKEAHTVDIETADDLKVRMANPPIAFDEKGKPKKYTPAELKELKGDPKLPGYAGDFDSLRPGQIVTIKLMKMKDTPKAKPTKDTDKELFGDNKPMGTMIMIVAEPVGN
jgi:hypothetical protein